eukprot:2022058-Amphidinium_carterae.1
MPQGARPESRARKGAMRFTLQGTEGLGGHWADIVQALQTLDLKRLGLTEVSLEESHVAVLSASRTSAHYQVYYYTDSTCTLEVQFIGTNRNSINPKPPPLPAN